MAIPLQIVTLLLALGAVSEGQDAKVGDPRVMSALRDAGWLYLDEAKAFTPEEVRRLDRWVRVSWWGDDPMMPSSEEPILGLGLEPTGIVRMVLPLSAAEGGGMRRGQKVTHYSVSSGVGPWTEVSAWPQGAEKAPTVWLRMEDGQVKRIERKKWRRPGLIDRGKIWQIYWYDRDVVTAFENAAREPGRAGKVLDLRGSPGGYTDAATSFLGLFLGSGKVLGAYEFRDELGRKRQRPWMTDSDARRVFDPKEWKILVDDQTASSAELVAEILGREGAEVVGGPTLGKHEVIELREGSYGWIVCTVGRYLIETRQKL
jgi:hypothetical protein